MRLTFIFLLFASLLQAQSNFLNATFKVDSASFVSDYNYILHGKVNGIGYGGNDANVGDRLIFMKDETCGELQIDSVLAASTFYLRVRVFSVDSLFDASPFGVGVLTGKTPNNDFRSSTINASNDLINCIENRFKLEVDAIDITLPDSLIYGKGAVNWLAKFSPNDSTITDANIRDDGTDITFALPEVAYGIDDTSTPDAGTYGYNSATGRFAYYNSGWRNLISGNVTEDYLMRADANGNAVNAGLVDDGSVLEFERPMLLKSYTTATLPTPATRMMVWNSDAANIGYYSGSAWEYPVKSSYETGLFTATRVAYADANGRLTDNASFNWKSGRLEIGVLGNENVFIQGGNSNTTGSDNTALGHNALLNNTTGSDNTALGFNALLNNTTGSENTALGRRALFSNTTGGNNTALGHNALFSNTTGGGNTALGRRALFSNTTGGGNTASGFNALRSNTTGSESTALGYNALFSNTTGNNNTALGYNALFSNTTGNNNIASGRDALRNNTTGSDNTALGRRALFSNTTGGGNTASGFNALLNNTTGNNNTASGFNALADNTTGNNNIASGEIAGRFTSTGDNLTLVDNSVFIGYNTRAKKDSATNEIVIGFEAVGIGSNTATVGNNDITKLKSNNYIFNVDQDTTGKDGYLLTFNSASSELELQAPAASGQDTFYLPDGTLIVNGDTITMKQEFTIEKTIFDADNPLPDSATSVSGVFNTGWWRVPESLDGATLKNASFSVFDKGDLATTGAQYVLSVWYCDNDNTNCTSSSSVSFTPSSERELEQTLNITLQANDIFRISYTPPQLCAGGCGTENVNGLSVIYTIEK